MEWFINSRKDRSISAFFRTYYSGRERQTVRENQYHLETTKESEMGSRRLKTDGNCSEHKGQMKADRCRNSHKVEDVETENIN